MSESILRGEYDSGLFAKQVDDDFFRHYFIFKVDIDNFHFSHHLPMTEPHFLSPGGSGPHT